jgi:lipopolysaccharide transport system ATP-binding protein
VGTQREGIRHYLRSGEVGDGSLRDRTDRVGSGGVRVVQVELRDSEGHQLDVASAGSDIEICLHYEVEPGYNPRDVVAAIQLRTQYDMPVFQQHNRLTRQDFGAIPRRGTFVCAIPRLPLAPSAYRLTCSLTSGGEMVDLVEDAMAITVVGGDFFSSGEVPPDTHGCSLVDAEWRVEPLSVGVLAP